MHIKIRDHTLHSYSEIFIHGGNNLLQCVYVSDIIPLKKFAWTYFAYCHIFDWSRLNPTGAGNCCWYKQPIWVNVVVISSVSLVLSHVLFCGPKLLLVVVRITQMLTDYTSPASQGQTKSNTSLYTTICRKQPRICVKFPLNWPIDLSLFVGSSDSLIQ